MSIKGQLRALFHTAFTLGLRSIEQQLSGALLVAEEMRKQDWRVLHVQSNALPQKCYTPLLLTTNQSELITRPQSTIPPCSRDV